MTPWKPGQSGNPKGKHPGSRNKVSLAIDALLEGQHEALTQRCIARALEGDMLAMKLCLERLAPPKRESPARVEGMPKVTDANSAIAALSRLIEAASTGEATPGEATALGQLVCSYLSISAITEFAQRLAQLEADRNERDQAPTSVLRTIGPNGSEPPGQ